MNNYTRQLAKQSKRRKELMIEYSCGLAVDLDKHDGVWYCICRDMVDLDTSFDGRCLHVTRLSEIDPHEIALTICASLDSQEA